MTGESVVIKKSPFVLVKNLLLLEFVGATLYFLAAIFGNYEFLYDQLHFPNLLSYEIARFVFVLGAELCLVVFVFLRWFFETYTVSPMMVLHEWGAAVKRREMISLSAPLEVTWHFGPFSRFFNYGALVIRGKDMARPLLISGVPSPKRYAKIVSAMSHHHATPAFDDDDDVARHLLSREHEQLEFKTSFRWDVREGRVNRSLERAALKTVAAFLNSGGGRLVVGIGNAGDVNGLAADYATLPRPDADSFENHFTNVFREVIGAEFRRFVKLSFHNVEGREVCMIRVAPSTKPVYATFDGEEAFFIRTGNSTTSLQMSKVPGYTRSRWREA